MNKRESELSERLREVYCGILHGNQAFHDGEQIEFSYLFDCPDYAILRERYSIERIAGKGGDFERAKALTRWLQPKLAHKGDYDNHISCNALSLLEYSFERPAFGINCAAKAETLVECCLALGIYARRLGLYPNSPYDTDNHVVVEVFDRRRRKWIVLDPTSGGYFTDGTQPLSALEARGRFAALAPCSILLPRRSARDMEALVRRNTEWNVYYAKNLFLLSVEIASGSGAKGGTAFLSPHDFSVREWRKRNLSYRIEVAERCGMQEAAAKLREAAAEEYEPRIGSLKMWEPPI